MSVIPLSTELAVMLAAATGRQAATPTARLQTRLAWKRAPVSLLTPLDGAFNAWTASLVQPCVAPEQRSIANATNGTLG